MIPSICVPKATRPTDQVEDLSTFVFCPLFTLPSVMFLNDVHCKTVPNLIQGPSHAGTCSEFMCALTVVGQSSLGTKLQVSLRFSYQIYESGQYVSNKYFRSTVNLNHPR